MRDERRQKVELVAVRGEGRREGRREGRGRRSEQRLKKVRKTRLGGTAIENRTVL